MVIKDKIEEFLQSQADRKVFYEHEVKGILRELGMAVPKGIFIRRGKSIPADSGLSFPLVAKVVSSRITAKSDIGGVRLGIGNGDELRSAVAELSRLEDSEGVLVEEMAPPGFEVIVGGTVDATFGPIIMFGLGGIYVEVMKDVAFRAFPLTRHETMEMISQVHSYPLLLGVRGEKRKDIDAVADTVVKIGTILKNCKDISDIEVNPLVVYPQGEGVVAVDVRILLTASQEESL